MKISQKRWIFAVIDKTDGDVIVFDSLSLIQAKKLLGTGIELLVQWDGKLWQFVPDSVVKDYVVLGRMIAEVA
jgi:hypothetical protein